MSKVLFSVELDEDQMDIVARIYAIDSSGRAIQAPAVLKGGDMIPIHKFYCRSMQMVQDISKDYPEEFKKFLSVLDE